MNMPNPTDRHKHNEPPLTTTPSSSMATPTTDLGSPPIHDIISLHWYLSQYTCSRDCPNFVTSHHISLLLDFHIHQLANCTENISLPHLLMGAQPRLLYHSIPTTTERNASLKYGIQHFIPPFLQSFHTYNNTLRHLMLNIHGSHNFQIDSRGVLHVVPSIQ